MMYDDDLCPNCVTPWKCNGPHLWHTDSLMCQAETRDECDNDAHWRDEA